MVLLAVRPDVQQVIPKVGHIPRGKPLWKRPIEPIRPNPFEDLLPLNRTKDMHLDARFRVAATIAPENLDVGRFTESLMRHGRFYTTVVSQEIRKQTMQMVQNYIYLWEIIHNGNHYRKLPEFLKTSHTKDVLTHEADQLSAHIIDLEGIYTELPALVSTETKEKERERMIQANCAEVVSIFKKVNTLYQKTKLRLTGP